MTDYNENLRFDRRLARRRGWITPDDLASALDGLPDVSDKIAPPEEESADDSPAPPADPTAGA